MRSIVLALGLLIALAMPALAETPRPAPQPPTGFAHPQIAQDADRYETYLKSTWKPGSRKPAELRAAGEKALGLDPRAASRDFALAVAGDPANAESWLGLSRALLAIKADDKGSERYDLPVNGTAAAYRAYERAATPQAKARALDLVAQGLQRRSLWRPAIDALKASLALADDQAIRQQYEKLRLEHGFRMLDYRADSDAQTPRLCLVFSERLSREQSDFAKFVSIDGKDPENVVAEDKQLCIEGLAHGGRYQVKLRSGLPSDGGDKIEKPAELSVYLPDRKPFVRFTGKAYVLPSRGQQGIPVVTVNTTRVGIEVYRVGDRSLVPFLQGTELQRQLSSYDVEQLKDKTGARAYAGELETTTRLNEEVTTAFPVSEAMGTLKPGAYVMTARPADRKSENGNELATQWFVVSDMGLTALTGDDGVHVFVRSLASAEPLADASVKLVAKNNEVLGQVKSDARGYVRFDAGLAKGDGGSQPAILVAENGQGEYAFLDLTQNAFDLTDRGVKGRAAPGPLDGFVFAERGVYRPGESVHLTALVRDRTAKAAALPVTLVVTRPDGVEFKSVTLSDQGLGGRSYTLQLSGGAMTGTWRAKLHADPKSDAIAATAFLVEDFVPERLDMTLENGSNALKPDAPLNLTASGRFLYGPPAADLGLEGEITVKASTKDVAGFPGYKFGLADEKFTAVKKPLEGLPNTDAAGKAALAISLPAISKTARALEADIAIKLREPGGRTIERVLNVPVDLGLARVGIRSQFGQSGLQGDDIANLDVIYVDAGGKQVGAKQLRWELLRLDTSWQWYSRNGSWAYEAVTLTRKVANGTLDTLADAPARIASKVPYGRFRLEVSSVAPDGPASSFNFNAGWFAAEDKEDSPENLELALDKPSYGAGDTAKVRIASRVAGKALLAVIGNNGLIATSEVEVPKGGGEFPLTVEDKMSPGAYVTALMYRPMDEKAKRMPSRAIGVKWLAFDTSAKTLKVAIDAPEKIKSGSSLVVPVKIGGLKPGEDARLTVAAVDVGILNLTRYQAPAPENWFYQQRLMSVDIRDFYGRLIDGMHADRGRLRSGGDASDMAGALGMDGSPPVEATVSLYSGVLRVDADGNAKAEFTLPDFNGSVRLMAVAWSADKIGHASKDTIVRDPVALTVAAPRFLTLGDEARLDFSVHNVDGQAGDYKVAFDETIGEGAKPSSIAAKTVPLKAGERRSERVGLKPKTVGRASYDVSVTGPGGIDVKRRLTFDVKPPAGDVKRTTVSSLAAKGGKITLSQDLLQDLIASRSKVNVTVGPAALLDVAGVLAALDKYPYGCAEQTVSRALPLVYANTVATQLGLGVDKVIRERVQGAIDRVLEMQDSSGAFGVWGPYATDMWLTAYVTDFLTRAKEANYTVAHGAFQQALDRLANFVSFAQDSPNGGESRAYALYVLARNGRAPIGELRYWADAKLDKFTTPLAKAQLGAALSMVGDKERAERSFKAALVAFDASAKDTTRADFGSRLRDGAALVTLASESGVGKAEAPRLVNLVSRAYRAARYTSTQEQSWMLLAAHALGEEAKQTVLTFNGQTVSGSLLRAIPADQLKAGPVTITNEGDAAVDAVISVTGASLTPEPPASKGFRVERSYYTLDGKPVDLKAQANTVKQNERFVAVLNVEAKEAGGRVLLVDRLPAGFEIENPHLVEGGDTKSLSWLKSTTKPEHAEFRDDRFVAAFNFFGQNVSRGTPANHAAEEGEESEAGEAEAGETTPPAKGGLVTTASVAYIVRAVTPGTFVHPAVTVEDMYRPDRYARTKAGTLVVTAKE
jgi:uncharacterized protein YfaS (alpha-2-macroglobulin family)